MLRVAKESAIENKGAILAMVSENWAESGMLKDEFPAVVDVGIYQAIENAGLLLSLFLYYDDKIIGYSINTVTSHPHASGMKVCRNDSIYIRKDYRTKMAGVGAMMLIKETEVEAIAAGADAVMWSAKPGSGFDLLLRSMRYDVGEIVYQKRV